MLLLFKKIDQQTIILYLITYSIIIFTFCFCVYIETGNPQHNAYYLLKQNKKPQSNKNKKKPKSSFFFHLNGEKFNEG